MSSAGQGPRHVTTQQLVDLVLDPRDPGYEAAAARHAGTVRRRWYDQPLVAAGAVVVGFVLAVSWVHTHRSAPQAAKVHDQLVSQVRTAESTVTDLTRTAAGLSAELERVRSRALAGSGRLVRTLDREQLLAGLTAVHGPGLEVTLAEPKTSSTPTDAAGRATRGPTTTPHILIDRDVRSVVNQLWSDGAEAIAVNGIRLTTTSAIRFAGDAVLVDLLPISSPYRIDAIGNPDTLITGFAASDVASRYQTMASARGIGFSFTQQSALDLPGSANTPLRYARVAK
ncbi:MAG TPA: DUF881 domain-containing protein [Jatrophihabitans sp.]|jgi:uncharacterized protein YlxW (UPF0749 family)